MIQNPSQARDLLYFLDIENLLKSVDDVEVTKESAFASALTLQSVTENVSRVGRHSS